MSAPRSMKTLHRKLYKAMSQTETEQMELQMTRGRSRQINLRSLQRKESRERLPIHPTIPERRIQTPQTFY